MEAANQVSANTAYRCERERERDHAGNCHGNEPCDKARDEHAWKGKTDKKWPMKG